MPKAALWFSFTPADSNSHSKWQCALRVEGAPDLEGLWMQRLSDLCHLASAQRTKGGCVIGMLMPAAPSVPPSLSQSRNLVRQLCVQKTHRSGEARPVSQRALWAQPNPEDSPGEVAQVQVGQPSPMAARGHLSKASPVHVPSQEHG